MDDRNEMCELHRLDDLGRLSEVEWLLQARGIETDIWPENRGRRGFRARRGLRLMVECRDLVYARWVASAAGLDTWPQEPGEGEVV